MSDKDQKASQTNADQPDAGLAAETRPVPSQAEGDEETVDQDLLEKQKAAAALNK